MTEDRRNMNHRCIIGASFVYRLMCTFLAVFPTLVQIGQTMDPPPGLGRPHEKFTNSTIDELITRSMGGIEVASKMIPAYGGKILAELDMYLDDTQFLSLYQPLNDDGIRTKRKAVRDTRLVWTDAETPYLFAKEHFNKTEKYMVQRAMTEFERYTCIRFRPAVDTDRNSVRFQNGVGCNSMLGMVGGVQPINLNDPDCRYKGLYLHEIGHALGLVHEHQLPDRDDYISIIYKNVKPDMREWFNKYSSDEVNQMGVKYEYCSVMHYGITAFSHDGMSQTIRAKDKTRESSIGRVYLKELAYSDVQILNLMYNCTSHCSNQGECGPDGHLDQNCKCLCRDGSSDCSKHNSKNNATACVNNYDSWACYIWANQGECERIPLYMKQECAKACGVCGSDVSANGSCSDVFQKRKCQIWKGRGDCVTNQRWMQINCRATCGLCGDVANRPQVNCNNSADYDAKCDELAKDGDCIVNPHWMFTNCRKSCALCDVNVGGFGNITSSVDEDNSSFRNNASSVDEDNSSFRDTTSGVDEDNSSFRNTTSGVDEDNSSFRNYTSGVDEDNSSFRNTTSGVDEDNMACENNHPTCEEWAASGECAVNPIYMIPNCRKACDKCDDVACENNHPTCEEWAASGECAVNPIYMIPNCRKACDKCDDAPCRNQYTSDTECDIWAKHDHCSINPGWMKENCARSCQVCKDAATTATNGTTVSNSTVKPS